MKIARTEATFVSANFITTGVLYKFLDYSGSRTGQRSGATMLAAALLATLVLGVTGWALLHYEDERRYKTSPGLVYHAVSVAVAAIGWGVAYALSDYVQPIDLAWIATVGGGSLLTHWLFVKNNAKGISSKKAFL